MKQKTKKTGSTILLVIFGLLGLLFGSFWAYQTIDHGLIEPNYISILWLFVVPLFYFLIIGFITRQWSNILATVLTYGVYATVGIGIVTILMKAILPVVDKVSKLFV